MTTEEIYKKAGFPLKHGEAFQQIADQTDRIIVSRCAQTDAIQLLVENYSSKGFGIKAKSCDWGPMTGFAMGHFQYAKQSDTSVERYEKQIKFFSDSDHTGFENKDMHLEMAAPDVLRVTAARLEYLVKRKKIEIFPGIRDGAKVSCPGPFGRVDFVLIELAGSEARWAFLHKPEPPEALRALALKNKGTTGVDNVKDWGKMKFLKGMVNLLPEDRNLADPAKNCVAGDFDLWAVFARKGSSMAEHGMERQARIFPGVNPKASAGIRQRVSTLRDDLLDRAPTRTHVKMVTGVRQEFTYKEDPELGNVSPLLADTMHKLNKRIAEKGYLGGRMVHHNDDIGNPFRTDVEEKLIAFVPNASPVFIENAGYYGWIEPYKGNYLVADNPAIWGKRG